MQNRSSTLVILCLSIVFSHRSARADDFAFSFTNTVGTVAGSVTGEILGLQNNATSSATAVIIDSYPSGLPNILEALPADATLWNVLGSNTFTVMHGQITAADFESVEQQPVCAQINATCTLNELRINVNNGYEDAALGSWIITAGITSDVQYVQSLSPGVITFTRLHVPEPSSLIVLVGGCLLILSRIRQWASR
jgi:hypothetical protein